MAAVSNFAFKIAAEPLQI